MKLSDLPQDILLYEIISYFNFTELLPLSNVNKKLQCITNFHLQKMFKDLLSFLQTYYPEEIKSLRKFSQLECHHNDSLKQFTINFEDKSNQKFRKLSMFLKQFYYPNKPTPLNNLFNDPNPLINNIHTLLTVFLNQPLKTNFSWEKNALKKINELSLKIRKSHNLIMDDNYLKELFKKYNLKKLTNNIKTSVEKKMHNRHLIEIFSICLPLLFLIIFSLCIIFRKTTYNKDLKILEDAAIILIIGLPYMLASWLCCYGHVSIRNMIPKDKKRYYFKRFANSRYKKFIMDARKEEKNELLSHLELLFKALNIDNKSK